MLSEILYLVRSRVDGSYLAAYPKGTGAGERQNEQGYLLVFREHYDALSYLNTFAKDVADRFATESIPGTQLKAVINRWGFKGVGVVQDPLLPRIEFLLLE